MVILYLFDFIDIIYQKHHLSPVIGLAAERLLPVGLPLAVLHQAQLKGQGEAFEGGEVVLIVGDCVASAIGLHHQLVHHVGQAVEGRQIAVGAPVQQARDAQGTIGGELPTQLAQEAGVVGQSGGGGIEVDLDPHHPVAMGLPGGTLAQQIPHHTLGPLQGRHPIA